MGSPLSPVVSCLYMEFFETLLLPKVQNFNPIIWLRYVDDVFCLLEENTDIDKLLLQINSLRPSIQFTLERECDRILPFLDVLIHRHGPNFEFSVYRKPTNTNSLIHRFSYHDISIKRSVISSSFLRALRICSQSHFEIETRKLFSIFCDLGYPHSFISSIFRKTKNKYKKPPSQSIANSPKNILVLPYSNNLRKFKSILKNKFDTRLVFKYNNTIRKFLVKNSPADLVPGGGVYVVPCKDCSSCYIGETIKTLPTRINQHKYDIRRLNEKNSIFRHISENSHNIDWKGASFVFKSRDKTTLQFIESILISLKPNFNLSTGFYQVPDPIIQHLQKKSNIFSQIT